MFRFNKIKKVEKDVQELTSQLNQNHIKDLKEIEKINELEQQDKQEVQEKVEDNFIWVDGYTVMEKNKKIVLNKEYKTNITIKNNFHDTTVPELNIKYKIFKVKGLINKKEINEYRYNTKSIIFIKEYSYQDLLKYMKRDLKFVKNQEEYDNCFDYDKLRKEKYVKQMIKLGFTELFARAIYNKVIKSTYIVYHGGYIGNEQKDNCVIDFLTKAKAYKEENLSNDMLIYLLLEELNQ